MREQIENAKRYAVRLKSGNEILGSITEIKGENLPYCDIWIGGFPCQDISCAGKMKGFDFKSSTRSSLGWEKNSNV